MKPTSIIYALLFLTISAISCTSNCGETFVKEYNNQFGHYYGFEKRVVFDNSNKDTLAFYGSKNFENATDIKLIFFSKSYQLHFAEISGLDPKLRIKFGRETDTVRWKLYNRDRKSQVEETVSYEIPIQNLQNILDKRKSVSVEFSPSNYQFILTDELACCLQQLIDQNK